MPGIYIRSHINVDPRESYPLRKRRVFLSFEPRIRLPADTVEWRLWVVVVTAGVDVSVVA
jgi:hypothetical protein